MDLEVENLAGRRQPCQRAAPPNKGTRRGTPLTCPGSAAAPLQTCAAGTAPLVCWPAPAFRAPAHPCTSLLGHRLSRSPNPCCFRVWNKKLPVVTSLHGFGMTSKPKAASREAQAPGKVGHWPGRVEEPRASPRGGQRHHPTMGNETQLLWDSHSEPLLPPVPKYPSRHPQGRYPWV